MAMTENSLPPRTLMAVLAHPDDESTTVGGTLALYSPRGIRTVLVTCTNGEYGDRPYGVKPSLAHNSRAMSKIRLAELRAACDLLEIRSLELLGYHDSGTVNGFEHRTTVFCDIAVETVALDIGAMFESTGQK